MTTRQNCRTFSESASLLPAPGRPEPLIEYVERAYASRELQVTDPRYPGSYVRVLADSILPLESMPAGRKYPHRVTTLCIRYWRGIHAEIMTHRDRARNSASSRAISYPTMLKGIEENIFKPLAYAVDAPGMATKVYLPSDVAQQCDKIIEDGFALVRDNISNKLAALGVSKSLCNRYLEPFSYITVVMTATHWNNFFRLRVHTDAEVHFQHLSAMMAVAMDNSVPIERQPCTSLDLSSIPRQSESPLADMGITADQLHLPFVSDADREAWWAQPDTLVKLSSARAAGVSYERQDRARSVETELGLYAKLANGSGWGHHSPREHALVAAIPTRRYGPFSGFCPHRLFETPLRERAEDVNEPE